MITVHGYLGAVDVALCELAVTADLVAAPSRVLDATAVPPERRIPLGSVDAAVRTLAAADAELDIRVLASGDPLFFGLVRRLRRAGLPCRVVPGVSSVAAAFAAVALPWDDAVVASAHGRNLAPVLAACRAHPKVAVFTAPESGAVEIAEGLSDLRRWYVVAERLGELDERVRMFDGVAGVAGAGVSDPHVVIVLAQPIDDAASVGASVSFAGDSAPDAARAAGAPVSVPAAVVFGRLMPGLGDLVAVNGAVGEEVRRLAARAGAAVVSLAEGQLPGSVRPSYVVCDDPRWLGLATVATALVTADPPGHRAGGERERLDVTGPDGRTRTSYLTFVPGGTP